MTDLVVIVIAIVGCFGSKKTGVVCLSLIGLIIVIRLMVHGL